MFLSRCGLLPRRSGNISCYRSPFFSISNSMQCRAMYGNVSLANNGDTEKVKHPASARFVILLQPDFFKGSLICL